jgi:hypothetical protein
MGEDAVVELLSENLSAREGGAQADEVDRAAPRGNKREGSTAA